jgi:hypothetical protein
MLLHQLCHTLLLIVVGAVAVDIECACNPWKIITKDPKALCQPEWHCRSEWQSLPGGQRLLLASRKY